MNLRSFAIYLLIFSALSTLVVFAQESEKSLTIPHQEYKLENGLRVILHEDHSTPIVAVNVWYHVGSKNEVPGKTGFAHLFEHMMFQGSKHYDKDYFGPLQEAGANINGSTNGDRTNYYEVVPSNFLELALWLESDRMGFLLDAMTLEKLNNQRDVVKNERRQRYDNQPYGTSFEKISELIYPREHPYNWTTIGSMADLSAASMEDVQSFFRKYYAPHNASLVIAGDFDPEETKAFVAKYFGSIKKSNHEIERPNPSEPQINGEVRFQMEDSVQLNRLYMIWHTPKAYDTDEPALDILSQILSSGRGSRLQSSLVYDKQISQDVGVFNFTRELSGIFYISSTAKPGNTTEEIEKEILAQIQKIKETPPSQEEITRALNSIESDFIFGLQTVLGKADQMNSYATFTNDPDYLDENLKRYRKVTAEDVQRVANQYLDSNRLVMNIVPHPKDYKPRPVRNTPENHPTSVGKDIVEENTVEKTKMDSDWRYEQPQPKGNPQFSLPEIQKSKLENGLEVWLVQQKELPIVSLNMVFKTGSSFDPVDKSGLNDITSSLLDDGTKTRSAVDISNELQSIGASLGTGNSNDSSNVSMLTLTKNFDKALDIYSDVIQNAIFPEEEVEKFRNRILVSLLQRRDNPNAISAIVYNKVLYSTNHPYGSSVTENSVKAISRDSIIKYHKTFFSPNNATLVVVGDMQMKELLEKLNPAFQTWTASEIPTLDFPKTEERQKSNIYLVDKPGAAQSVINIGQIGVARDCEDYIPLLVMNQILGGQFSARVNMNLREEKGYTYGARTSFSFRKKPGPFTASASVQTAVTKESVTEFMKELQGIQGTIPVTEQELNYNKQSLIRRFPRTFETVGQISNQLDNVVVYNLPTDYFNEYITKINAVTLEDVKRVANKYLQPDKMAIVIVGDKNVIEPKLKEIEGLGDSIIYLDSEGNIVE